MRYFIQHETKQEKLQHHPENRPDPKLKDPCSGNRFTRQRPSWRSHWRPHFQVPQISGSLFNPPAWKRWPAVEEINPHSTTRNKTRWGTGVSGSSGKWVRVITGKAVDHRRRPWRVFWVTGGRPSLFQKVTEWGTPWPGPHFKESTWWEQQRALHRLYNCSSAATGEDREQRRGLASPVRNALKWPGREPWNRKKPFTAFHMHHW